MWPVPDRWDVSKSHRGITRVELWSQGNLLSASIPFLAGSVTEKRVTGIRMTLSITLEPSPDAYRWMRLPALELRPYSGIDWGSSQYLVPLGQFPIVAPPPLTLPRAGISITADDHWSRMVNWHLPYGIVYPDPPTLRVVDMAAILMNNLEMGVPTVTASSSQGMPATVYDKDKSASDIVISLMDVIGAEAFVDRVGQVIIQDRVTAPGDPLTDGPGGTIIGFTTTEDWTDVYNEIAVFSSNNDTGFMPAYRVIDDPHHPAYWANGLGRKAFTYSSPLFTDPVQAWQAAGPLLDKKATAALGWTVTAVPDPSRMAGDAVTVTTSLGTVNAVIQEVKHDLAGGPMTITLGAA